jgi:hypothetical protein
MTKPAKNARQIIEVTELDLSDEAEALLRDPADQSPREFLQNLMEHRLYYDAVPLLAIMLPRRDALRWGLRVAADQLSEEVDERYRQAYHTIEEWFRDSSEINRRRVETQGERCKFETAIGFLAMAVFFSEGSVSEPGSPETYPRPYAYAHAIGGCVTDAAHLGNPDSEVVQQRLVEYLVDGQKLQDKQLRVI